MDPNGDGTTEDRILRGLKDRMLFDWYSLIFILWFGSENFSGGKCLSMVPNCR